jgi:hypothetical protein
MKILILFTFFFSTYAFAAQCPDFNGTYKSEASNRLVIITQTEGRFQDDSGHDLITDGEVHLLEGPQNEIHYQVKCMENTMIIEFKSQSETGEAISVTGIMTKISDGILFTSAGSNSLKFYRIR